MSHPLLRASPLLAALADDLRERPGRPADTDGAPARAAVAIVLRIRPPSSGQGPEGRDVPPPAQAALLDVLLIQRAVREGDPWSGQVAFPGGRYDPTDLTLQHTAIRETLEETGLDLDAEGHALGILDELRPRTPVLPPIIVSPFVFVTESNAAMAASDEVAAAFWAPWALFVDPLRVDESTIHVRGAEWRVPSYTVEDRVIWGMTERMLRQLSARIDRVARGRGLAG